MKFFNTATSLFDYNVWFTDSTVTVNINIKSAKVSDKTLIKFWAFYYSKIMFNFKETPQLQSNLLTIFKLIDVNYAEDNPDCFKATGLDNYYTYTKVNGNYELKCNGEFFYIDNCEGLNTNFPLDINTLQVVTSAVAIFQYVNDRLSKNDESMMILYKTLSVMNGFYIENTRWSNDLINLVSLPQIAYSEALDSINHYSYMFAKIIIKKSIEEGLYLYNYINRPEIESIERNNFINKTILPDIVIAHVHILDRVCFLHLNLEDRNKFMGLVLINAIELLLNINSADMDDEEDAEEREFLKNQLIDYYYMRIKLYSEFKEMLIKNLEDHDELSRSVYMSIGKRIYSCICDDELFEDELSEDELRKKTFNIMMCMAIFIKGENKLKLYSNIKNLEHLLAKSQ